MIKQNKYKLIISAIISIWAKNILRELKNILAKLFSTGEIDRIDEIK